MARLKYFLLANSMVLGNFLANLLGVMVMGLLDRFGYMESVPRTPAVIWLIVLYDLFALLTGLIIFYIYERPIRRHLRNLARKEQTPRPLLSQARRRLLNEPWLGMGLSLGLWILAAIVFPIFLHQVPTAEHLAPVLAVRALFVGLLTMTSAFFVLEHILQHRLAPVFFPQGGLTRVRGARRISIGLRLGMLVMASSMIPFLAIFFTIQSSKRMLDRGVIASAEMLGELQTSVLFLSILFMVNAASLAFLTRSNLVHPLREIIRALRQVREGDFNARVEVMANDEVGYTGEAINQMTAGLAERERIKDTFGKYVSQQVRDEILAGRIPLDGEIKQVTMLFSDLRNFTPLVENTDPKQVVQIINGYFTRMTEAVEGQSGLVLQYVGDEIEAVFGAPLALAGHPRLALEAAWNMRAALAEYNALLAAQGGPVLRHGIGIHTGPAMAANIGGGGRLSYALVGDTVNLAARLQDLTKALGRDILLSGTTAAALGSGARVEHLENTLVKGRSQPVEVYAAL
ncbi:MAG: adenylate/guanylate cyclase domain-containing protein [Desulfarculaceae bacterium]|nr:adenylate/guanylate cyclase domain-containing protein [Desulfarculaceae bacterium]MCF8072707.1 adenylate/guanylate cyclase domain-containing protein [Desulfarculaceae bacterium]MCF8102586.1 adenylate/guanylate cyclase domain-containing protein [Desulfarculaceae bacterium]MCF8116495.1 adenylate/guanylate cyclase domain-containing protein [Desulfarculaceae bacterium]